MGREGDGVGAAGRRAGVQTNVQAGDGAGGDGATPSWTDTSRIARVRRPIRVYLYTYERAVNAGLATRLTAPAGANTK